MGVFNSGFTVVANTIDQTIKEMQKRENKALEAVGIIVERHAKRNAPFYVGPYRKGGTLQKSITHNVDSSNKTVTIGSDVKYAVIQEVNNYSHKKGRSPYLRPAITENLDELNKKVIEIMENG